MKQDYVPLASLHYETREVREVSYIGREKFIYKFDQNDFAN